jgi:hypothetical protein
LRAAVLVGRIELLVPRRRLAEAAKEMLVLQAGDAGRPTEVIGVIDVHQPTGEHGAALQTLRERAALIGANAVLGVEFHHEDDHPDDKGIATHLSGLAVRFRTARTRCSVRFR